jgi:hypothetical protein
MQEVPATGRRTDAISETICWRSIHERSLPGSLKDGDGLSPTEFFQKEPVFTLILAALLDEDWTMPKIEELFITSDRWILAQPTGDMTHKLFIGAKADLIRNIHGIAEVAGLDGDELGYLLEEVANARRID